MTLFLSVMIFLMAVSVFGNLVVLVNGRPKAPTPAQSALNVFVNGCLIVWAVVLLVKM